MSSCSTWSLPLFPGYTLTVGLFLKDNNHNGENIIESSECIIVDATIIPDILLIQSAACRALSSLQYNSLVTKSLLDELVFFLYPSNNFNLLKEFYSAASYAFYIQLLNKEGKSLEDMNFLPLEMHKDILDKSRIAKIYSLTDFEYSPEKHLKQCLNSVICKRV